MAVVAEGVETRERLEFLQEQGCSEPQGYYFSRPVAAREFKPITARISENMEELGR